MANWAFQEHLAILIWNLMSSLILKLLKLTCYDRHNMDLKRSWKWKKRKRPSRVHRTHPRPPLLGPSSLIPQKPHLPIQGRLPTRMHSTRHRYLADRLQETPSIIKSSFQPPHHRTITLKHFHHHHLCLQHHLLLQHQLPHP